DPRAVARALRQNLGSGRVVSGASTITMQLARLLFRSDRDRAGKLAQALQALRLERHLDKAGILEQYLNRVPLGQGAIGVAAAARLYFSGTAADLSLGQAALLAGLAQYPSGSNPLVSVSRARRRRAAVLARLEAAGYARPQEAARALDEPVAGPPAGSTFLAPHFTTRVLAWSDSLGMPPAGVRRTSLDLSLQIRLEAEVRHTVEQLGPSGGRHAAAVVLDNSTGEILAWVGSPDFWADTAGQVDMVVSPRQPGSALKPFLYGLAFDRGFTPASVLPDIARTYATSTGPYRPRNYDRRFHGPVRAREALGSSYNVPAVELAERLGAEALLETLHLAGFESLNRSASHYGLGLALGNGDVTLLELANGYRALANGGLWTPVSWRASTRPPGLSTGTRVMTAGSAALVLDILSDPVARIPGFGLETPFDFPFQVAAKTGTSRHYTDNWAVGTTGNFTVAVWVGDFSGRPMEGVSGVSGAGPLLHRAILVTAGRYPPGRLAGPAAAGATPVTVCRLSGLRAGPRCPHQVEWFLPGTAPAAECDWHSSAGSVRLPVEYAEWADQNGVPRTEVGRTGGDSTAAGFQILSPRDGDRYRIPPGVDPRYATVALRAAGGSGGDAVTWEVDGHTYTSPRWRLEAGSHLFRARSRTGEIDQARIEVSTPD
ncbi:MAG: transglycosylase domain-containing protein, partial [Gemmatimonadales bacterium]